MRVQGFYRGATNQSGLGKGDGRVQMDQPDTRWEGAVRGEPMGYRTPENFLDLIHIRQDDAYSGGRA